MSKTHRPIRRIVIAIGGLAAVLLLSGCGDPFGGNSKRIEQYRDATVSGRNEAPATVGTMPDGFSNWAAKCDGPNRVYTIFHYSNSKDSGGDTYGSIAVVANDPQCAKAPR